MGSQMFVKNQYGEETTRGTAVAATKKFLGTVNIPKDRNPAHPEYAMGQRARSHQTSIRQLLADPVTLNMPNGYYQALPLFYGITLKGGVTASEVTTGEGDYLWDFTPSLTAAASPDTVTMEVGDDDQNYELEYLMGRKVTLDFAIGEDAAAALACEAFARQVSKSTATASTTTPTPIEIDANTAKLFIDPAWASLGSTQKTGLLRGGSIEIATGNHPKFFGNGVKYFSSHGEGFIDVTGSFIVEGGAAAVAMFDDYQAGTHRAVRLSFTGPAIGSGTAYSLIYDMFLAYDDVIPLSNFADGNTLYAVTFTAVSDNQSTPHNVGVKVTTNANTI